VVPGDIVPDYQRGRVANFLRSCSAYITPGFPATWPMWATSLIYQSQQWQKATRMNDRQKYLLAKSEQQSRYDDLAEMPDTLDADLALARTLAERAANAGSDGLASAILSVVAKLSAANVSSKIRQGELLERNIVMQMGRMLAEITTDEIRDRFEGWEDALDNITVRFDTAMKRKPLQLEHQ
jgi:hypothetical protein